jgi:L-iditol 2-dehydrogenase
MKAAVLRGPQDIRTENVVDPTVETDGVIIRVRACGVCGSD